MNGGVNQGICPDGWHLPTYSEWERQLDYVWTEMTLEEAIQSGAGVWYGSHGLFVPSHIEARLVTTEGNDLGTDDYDFSANLDRYYFTSTVCNAYNYPSLHVCGRQFDGVQMKISTSFNGSDYSVRCVKD